MAKQIFVGNVPYAFGDQEIQELFEPFGAVNSARIIMDRETGRSRGFAFVEMPNDAEAEAAINALNGSEAGGKQLTVNVARPRERR